MQSCLAFGHENVQIKKLFNDFVDFRHLSHVTKAGSESVNGFVLNLQYETMNYKANALLKSTKKKRSDNLYYEYLVGIKFINKVNEIFPCFTETYHLFEHDSATSKKSLLDNKLSVSEYSDAVKINDCDASVIKNSLICIDKSCKDGVNFAILVQYISNPVSVGSFIKKHENDKLFEEKMLCILYQIYACLSYLKDHFTHYDLHDENVLLYELPKGKFVNIKYVDERSGYTTIIKTNYIAKIIDYGRCYFGNLGNKSFATSKRIGQLVYESKTCPEVGLKNVGYNFFDKEATKDNWYISSLSKNVSHDLRLASIVAKKSKKMGRIFGKTIMYETKYGTPQKKTDNSANLHNVTDMFQFLEGMSVDDIASVSSKDKSIGTIVVNMTKILCEKKMTFVDAKLI
jgi:hypothetical protein